MARTLNVKIGWDAPLDVVFNVDIPDLRRQIQAFVPVENGQLRNTFDASDVIVFDPDEMKIQIRVGTHHKAWRYARIQDEGGYVPPFDIRNPSGMQHIGFSESSGRSHGPVMVANIGGQTRFFTKRRGFTLPGFNYINKGVISWLRGALPVTVKWRSGAAGQGLRQARGATLSGR